MDSFFHQNRLNHALKKWSTHTLQWVANWEIQLAHERKTFKITWNNNREFNLLTVKFNVIKNEIKSIHSICTENYCYLFRIFVGNLFWPITWLISNCLVQFKTLVVKIGKFPNRYPDRLEPLPSLNTYTSLNTSILPTQPHYIISQHYT